MRRAAIAIGLTVAALMAVAAAPLAAPGPASMPGPAPGPRAYDPVAENRACARCHTAIAGEWRASLHHRAYTDVAFQRSHAREPLPFCRGCHAPEADPRELPTPSLAHLGIGCVTCHGGRRDGVLATGPAPPSEAHPMIRSEAFAGVGACANCHQFRFPSQATAGRLELMQSTVREHAESPWASVPCADCHMPVVGEGSSRHRSHQFAASRDPTRLRSALDVAATREGSTVRLVLRSRNVGHAFPTGDLFRRLAIHAWAELPSGPAAAVRYLRRHFATVARPEGGSARRCVADDRLRPGEARTVDLDLGPAAHERPLHWRVSYERVSSPDETGQRHAQVEARVVLAEGTIHP